MRTAAAIVTGVVAVAAAAAAFYMIDVDQTADARLPEVSVKGGQLPAYEVQTGSVDVGMETTTVEVPEVEVSTQEVEVETPTIRITPPASDEENETAEPRTRDDG